MYDLRNPGRNYSDLYEAIKSYQTWGKITESVWAIVSNNNPNDIATFLHQFIDRNDRLMIIQSSRNAAWYNAIAEKEWLQQNLVK